MIGQFPSDDFARAGLEGDGQVNKAFAGGDVGDVTLPDLVGPGRFLGFGQMIFSKAKRPWYEIFLTVFVLLSNLEYVPGGSLSFYHAQFKTVCVCWIYTVF